MHARNGKIARLSREIRDQLNLRLEQSEESPQLLAWLNALLEVKKVLREHFDAVPISKQNLSEWRQGGFQEWLARQELWAGIQNMEEFAGDIDADKNKVLADDVATVLAARYAVLLTSWDGEVDEKFEAKTRVLNRVCRSVVQLQRSMHRAKKDNEEYIQRLEAETEKTNAWIKKKKLDQVWAIQREPAVAEIFGGGELAQKLAKYIVAVENDVPGATLEITQEDIAKAERSQRKKKPAKTAEVDAEETPNPLEESEMEAESEDESAPAESESVMVSQTDLRPISPISPAENPEAGKIAIGDQWRNAV